VPRHARILNEKQVYHVMVRGNNKEKVFVDHEDKLKIINTIKEKQGNGEYSIYAFCVMDNHLHLILKEGKSILPRIMKMIATSYAYYFNKKYNRVGHVFQDRYRSENIENDEYLLVAIRYVHQNPVKAGIGTIDGYKWSSFNEYMCDGQSITKSYEILEMFSKDLKRARAEFSQFNRQTSNDKFIDIAEEKEVTRHNVEEFVDLYLKERKLTIDNLKFLEYKNHREKLIEVLLNKSDLSKREIAVVLELNREVVRRAALSEES